MAITGGILILPFFTKSVKFTQEIKEISPLHSVYYRILCFCLGLCLCFFCFLLTGCGSVKKTSPSSISSGKDPSSSENPPSPPLAGSSDEIRGVWVSYKELNTRLQGKNVDQAKSELDKIMDNTVSFGLNTVIFHVRAMSDAYYPSSVYPVAQSVASLVEAGFDPLAYALDAAHKRNLKLHAWVNPYRVGAKKELAKSEDIFDVPNSGGSYWYYNPASADVQSLILCGIQEIIDKYPVDGVQFDDYFYPGNTTIIPPDSPSEFEKSGYESYCQQGGTLSVADWRRAQVDTLISGVYQKVHRRSGCVFGVSPDYSVSKNYSSYYADLEQWIAVPGYLDYICPQIYFGFENSAAPFDKAVAGWITMKKHSTLQLYVGLGIYKTGMSPDTYAGTGQNEWVTHDDVMKRSVELLRTQKGCAGMIFYNYESFLPSSRSPGNGQTYSEKVGKREIDQLLTILSPQQ